MDIKELQVSSEEHGKQNHPWEYARSNVVRSLVKKYLPKEANGYALDIGCGDVFFLTRFADKYPEYKLIAVDTAFDPELIAALSAKNSKYNIQFFKSIREITHLQKASIVFMMDVLEHIEDDVSFLKEVVSQSCISPDTLFVITVPAFQSLFCNHDYWLGHYRRYSRNMLKQHTASAGLSPLEDGYFFTSLLLPRFIQKMIEKSTKAQSEQNQGIGNYKGGAAKSFLIETFLMLDFHFNRLFRLIGIKMPGLSTYAICKKSK
ncbi:MAG: class I SAM-dependent methyltransferase [Tannerella sp.]|jgi:SAM-dependent methyltransferase|nr:class I SAM-dependent methyltransferase [Tannerella sp.]